MQLWLWVSETLCWEQCVPAPLGGAVPTVAGLHRNSSPVATALSPHRMQTPRCPPRAVCALQAFAVLGSLPGALSTPKSSVQPRTSPSLTRSLPGRQVVTLPVISVDALSRVTVSNANKYLPSVCPCCQQYARHPASPRSWSGCCVPPTAVSAGTEARRLPHAPSQAGAARACVQAGWLLAGSQAPGSFFAKTDTTLSSRHSVQREAVQASRQAGQRWTVVSDLGACCEEAGGGGVCVGQKMGPRASGDALGIGEHPKTSVKLCLPSVETEEVQEAPGSVGAHMATAQTPEPGPPAPCAAACVQPSGWP